MFVHTAAVFAAEALVLRWGGAARHGARLALLSAVFEAMLRSVAWTGETSINLAIPTLFSTRSPLRGTAYLSRTPKTLLHSKIWPEILFSRINIRPRTAWKERGDVMVERTSACTKKECRLHTRRTLHPSGPSSVSSSSTQAGEPCVQFHRRVEDDLDNARTVAICTSLASIDVWCLFSRFSFEWPFIASWSSWSRHP